jgi:hypothetical protein
LGKPEAAFSFLDRLIWVSKIFKLSRIRLSTLFSLHATAVFVASVQQKGAFVAHFFADQGSFWCNRPNFPKGGWPGSLGSYQSESLK